MGRVIDGMVSRRIVGRGFAWGIGGAERLVARLVGE